MLRWHLNTTYDLFISLFVLHRPKGFGLRASWAAGVRQRLENAQREALERFQQIAPVPLTWLPALPEGGDAAGGLDALEALPRQERFRVLFVPSHLAAEVRAALEALGRKEDLTPEMEKALRTRYRHSGRALKPQEMETLRAVWQAPEASVDAYCEALRAYHEAFFAEEETRIRPYLRAAIEEGRGLAEKLPRADLLIRLSRGVRLAALETASELTLAPSFWSTPLIFTDALGKGAHVMVFGARPEHVGLIPGVTVPDELVGSLKALADPTRLRILKYLLDTPATPTDLARHLRLRAPTVVHHLRVLRLAGLVQITIGEGHERLYALRPEGLLHLQHSLTNYLSQPE
ncbi:MAG: ArsR family transcriptional regulator [Anaerolineae bacterium]|nr:MAG: ArsR family transcriptional regulator [Anaerolineae bacterium]